MLWITCRPPDRAHALALVLALAGCQSFHNGTSLPPIQPTQEEAASQQDKHTKAEARPTTKSYRLQLILTDLAAWTLLPGLLNAIADPSDETVLRVVAGSTVVSGAFTHGWHGKWERSVVSGLARGLPALFTISSTSRPAVEGEVEAFGDGIAPAFGIGATTHGHRGRLALDVR